MTIEITYSVLLDGEEVGFGTSGECETIGQAVHVVDTCASRGDWERAPGMPSPAAVVAALSGSSEQVNQ